MKNESNTFVRRADARLFLSIVAAGLLSFSRVGIETAMNVTFPTLMEEFSISTSTVQWLTTGYLLVLALAVFGWQENLLQKVGVTPLLNLQVFQVPAFDGAVLGLLLIQFLCLGVGFLLPNYAQIVLGSDPFAAGCILLPGCLVGAPLAPVSGRLYDRLGARKPLLLGSCAIVLSFVLYQLALGRVGISGLTAIYVVFTLGQGLSAGNILTYALENLPESIQPDGNAVCNTLQQLAGAVGTSVCAALVAAGQVGRALGEGTSLGTAHAFHLLLILALCQGASMVWALGKNKCRVKSKEGRTGR